MTTPQLVSSSQMNSSGVRLPYSGYIPTGTSQTPMSGIDTTTSYEQSRRQVSSVVVSEQILGEIPESGGVRYIEVPVIEEVVKTVPRREVIEREKIVPRYEVEYVQKLVEVPQIQYIDRPVDKVIYEENVRKVPVKKFVDVPKEVVRHVAKPVYREVQKIVEVPGEIISVPKPYVVENPVYVKQWVDAPKPVVVAQTVCPVVTESQEVIDVDVFEYEPQVIPIDVHVAKPVAAHLVAVGATQEMHQVVTVPAAQYNTLLRSMNVHLGQDMEQLPYLREGHQVPFLAQHETPGTAAPAGNVAIHTSGNAAPMSAAQIMTREATVGKATSSMYQGQQSYEQVPMYRPADVESAARRGETASLHTASQVATAPAVYPNMMTRDTESSAKDVSQYKSRSRYSFTPSQPVQQPQHKRRGCQC